MDYSQTVSDLTKQIRKWLWLGIAVAAVFTAVAGVTVPLRMKVMTIAIAAVGWAAGLFLYEMKSGPLRSYRKFLMEMSDGVRHSAEGEVLGFSRRVHDIQGVQFWQLRFREARDAEKTSFLQDDTHERIVYVDAAQPRPALKKGMWIKITVTGNNMVSLDEATVKQEETRQ